MCWLQGWRLPTEESWAVYSGNTRTWCSTTTGCPAFEEWISEFPSLWYFMVSWTHDSPMYLGYTSCILHKTWSVLRILTNSDGLGHRKHRGCKRWSTGLALAFPSCCNWVATPEAALEAEIGKMQCLISRLRRCLIPFRLLIGTGVYCTRCIKMHCESFRVSIFFFFRRMKGDEVWNELKWLWNDEVWSILKYDVCQWCLELCPLCQVQWWCRWAFWWFFPCC